MTAHAQCSHIGCCGSDVRPSIEMVFPVAVCHVGRLRMALIQCGLPLRMPRTLSPSLMKSCREGEGRPWARGGGGPGPPHVLVPRGPRAGGPPPAAAAPRGSARPRPPVPSGDPLFHRPGLPRLHDHAHDHDSEGWCRGIVQGEVDRAGPSNGRGRSEPKACPLTTSKRVG